MRSELIHSAGELLRDAAARLMLPRWKQLLQHEIEEKSPGELVTVADREVESELAPALAALLPGSRVVGEEGCAANPALLDSLEQGDVWVLDPLDGTSNFIAGRDAFGTLLALLRGGETVGAWMYLPVQQHLYTAQLGGGAWCDGKRVAVQGTRDERALKGIVKTRYLPEGLREKVVARSQALGEVQNGANCTIVDYPQIAAGASDFAMYWRTLPWDHAAPALFLSEAGGWVARLDGTPYRPASREFGLVAAASRGLGERGRDLLGMANVTGDVTGE